MSAVGLPMDGHVELHFDARGLCCCPCDQCTLRLTQFCVCEDCPCEGPEDHRSWPEECRCTLSTDGVLARNGCPTHEAVVVDAGPLPVHPSLRRQP